MAEAKFTLASALLLVAICLPRAQGLLCFRCRNYGNDYRCLTSPRELTNTLMDCGRSPACTTFKRESISRGVIVEFFRGCDPPYQNHTEVIGDIRTTMTACHRDECNTAAALAAPALAALALSTALALALGRD